MPPRFSRCSAFSLPKSYSVSAPKARHKCLLGYQRPYFSCGDFSVGSASGSRRKKTFLVVQLRSWPWILYKHQVRLRISSTLQITSAERERWLSTLCRLKKYLAATMTKERDSTALTLMNIAIRRLAWVHIPIDTFARKHPWCLLLANILTE